LPFFLLDENFLVTRPTRQWALTIRLLALASLRPTTRGTMHRLGGGGGGGGGGGPIVAVPRCLTIVPLLSWERSRKNVLESDALPPLTVTSTVCARSCGAKVTVPDLGT
jgi:hypothetical protein